METLTSSLTRQDYDDLHDAFAAPGDYREMVSRMFDAVEQIVARHRQVVRDDLLARRALGIDR